MPQKRDRRKDNLGNSVAKQYYMRLRNNALAIFCAAFTYAFIVVMVLLETMPTTYDFTVGEAASETVYAIAEVEDTAATEEARLAARAAVADIYVPDKTKTAEELAFFENTVFSGLYTASFYGYSVRLENENDGGYIAPYDTAKVRAFADNELSFLKTSSNLEISSKVISVLDTNPDDIQKLRNWFMPQLEARLNEGITDVQIMTEVEEFTEEIRNTSATADQTIKDLLAEIVQTRLAPNSVIDEQATEKARQEAENAVSVIYMAKGEAIVEKDEIVTQNQYDMLKKLGMLKDGGILYSLVIGALGLVMVMLLLVVWYIVLFEKKIVRKPKNILLICLLVIVNIVIALVFKSVGWSMMMNTTMCAVLLVIFFEERLAIVLNTTLSVVMSMLFSQGSDLFGIESVALMVSCVSGGSVAIYVCKLVKTVSRGKLLLPGVVAGVVSMVTSLLMLSIAGKSLEASFIASLYSLAGGAVASILSTGSLSIWESMFNLLTQSKLLELTNSSSDLLRKISIEIPGTYQHSVAVAELAENAAKDIGANAMLARAASLYHDIGKMRMPECYTENQTAESQSFHSTLSPYESARMIFAHITEGVQMAKANKLPREIIDVIQQHHGTSAVLYFYNKAREIDPDTDINDFRYPGPNPQTKEAGIILLADCVEASVRSLDEKSSEVIWAQIEKMFKARMEDGELDECDLSLRDINTIKHSFAATLAAMYHTRIKYAEQEKKRLESGDY